jgi:hypothetical protein
MLEGVEAEVGEPGDVVAGRVYAEHAALIARSIALGESLLIQVRKRAFLVFRDSWARRRIAYPGRVATGWAI